MALTSNQIASAIRRKILEQTDSIVTDDVLFMNMNLAYDDIKMMSFTNDQIESATITLTSGSGTLPANFGTLYGPGYVSTTDKTPYEEKSIAYFDREPENEAITIEGNQIKVNPSSTSQIIIKYYPSYDPLTTTQNPEVNEYLHEPIIYGAMYRILEDMQEFDKAALVEKAYESKIAKRTSVISNYQEENAGGGQMFNGIRII